MSVKLFPLADNPTLDELRGLGLKGNEPGLKYLASVGVNPTKVAAVYAGAKRSPRQGEWYLSGAEVEAYRAPNDLTMEFHIARLVRVERREVFDIVAML